MKKMILSAVAAVVLALVAEEVSLGWVFTGYFENVSASKVQVAETVDASISTTAEVELDISSFPCGTVLLFR